MKKYSSITRLKKINSETISIGDNIVIQEKIDGANASFEYDVENDCMRAYSRRRELDEKETLQGFYLYVQSLEKEKFNKDYLYFGEWLVKHTVVYPNDKYRQFYCFDIYDKVNDIWLPQEQVTFVANELGLNLVPTFYIDKFSSWEHVYSFVGKTQMGGKMGEGVVVKKVGSRASEYIKVLSDEFTEVKSSKSKKDVSVEELNIQRKAIELTQSIVTKQRVLKLIHKLIEDELVGEDFGFADMKFFSNTLSSMVYYDCVEEELEITQEIEDLGYSFGRLCAKEAMNLTREACKENESI